MCHAEFKLIFEQLSKYNCNLFLKEKLYNLICYKKAGSKLLKERNLTLFGEGSNIERIPNQISFRLTQDKKNSRPRFFS